MMATIRAAVEGALWLWIGLGLNPVPSLTRPDPFGADEYRDN